MSHFAKVIDGIVTEVLVIEQDVIDTGLFGDPSLWIQTSYNTHGGQHPEGRPLRKNYAGVGYTYDSERDAFIPPRPFPSWTLNEETCLWDPPVPHPTDDKPYYWDENTLSWIEMVMITEPVTEVYTEMPSGGIDESSVSDSTAPLTTVISTVMPPAENN